MPRVQKEGAKGDASTRHRVLNKNLRLECSKEESSTTSKEKCSPPDEKVKVDLMAVSLSSKLYKKRFWILFLVASLIFMLNIVLTYHGIRGGGGGGVKIMETVEEVFVAEDATFLPCNVTLETAKKSLLRAKTEECKKEIRSVACRLQNGQLYPLKLSRDTCPLIDPRVGEYVGCFQDVPPNRLLSGYQYNLQETNTPEECVDTCLRIGFQAAGVQYRHECFCGDAEALAQGKMIDDQRCRHFECPGDPSKRCGGFQAMAVYKTGHGGPHLKLGIYPEPKKDIVAPKIAFLLQFNGRAVRQVKRLLKLIYRPWHKYYIHVDVRQEYMYREMKAMETELSALNIHNVRVKEKRFSTIWGGAFLLNMMLDAFTEMLEMWSDWDIAVNLSEADFLLLSLEEMEQFIAAYPQHSFMRSHGKATQKFIGAQGLDKAFVQCEDRMWRIGDRELIRGIRYDGGSDWVGIHRDLAYYVIHSKDTINLGLRQFYRYTLLPAESFFHTISANSKFCNRTVNANFKLTNWKRKIGCKCQYKHIVDWCGCSPSVFLLEDTKKLHRNQAETRLYFTARKFEAIIDQTVIDFVEAQALDRAEPNAEIRNHASWGKFWQSYYHYLDTDHSPGKEAIKDTASRRKKSDMETAAQKVFMDAIGLEVNRRISGKYSVPLQPTVEPLEINLLRQSPTSPLDILVKYHTPCENQKSMTIEAITRRKPHWKLYPNTENLLRPWRLVDMDVGTKFDPKEEIFRNYPGIMSEDSAPSLRHVWKVKQVPMDVKVQNLTGLVVVWTDPKGEIRFVSKPGMVSFDHLNEHSDLEPEDLDRPPMQAGSWKVQLLVNNIQIAEIEFPILPLTNSKSTSLLIDRFYAVNDFCLSSESQCAFSLPLCNRTEWSSEFPDPKSEIRKGYDDSFKMLI